MRAIYTVIRIFAKHWRAMVAAAVHSVRALLPYWRRLPGGRQIVLQHLRRRAHQARLDRAAVRSAASRQSFLRDLVDIEEAADRQPGE